jgi:hypothetical protein
VRLPLTTVRRDLRRDSARDVIAPDGGNVEESDPEVGQMWLLVPCMGVVSAGALTGPVERGLFTHASRQQGRGGEPSAGPFRRAERSAEE